jgi:hypothetical protein
VNPGTNGCAVESATEDAVNDGMDVLNLSLGSDMTIRLDLDPEVQAIESAVAMGVSVVISAGNGGPDPNTIASPGTAPSAITVGAMNNDRYFAAPFTVGGHGPYAAIPAVEVLPSSPITAPLADISSHLDSSGLACSALPSGSLSGTIALILAGTCSFEDKLNNAQWAGAVAALVYADPSNPDATLMDVANSAFLPAEMVSSQDGLAIKQLAASTVQATMAFTLAPFAIDPNTIAPFSSLGPSVDLSIKPDLLTVGENFYTAAQRSNPAGELYNAQGYVLSQGTSFSAPLAAGAVAALKAARPGFAPFEYKSMLVNSAASAFPGQAHSVQNTGGGILDLNAAMLATLAVNPASVSFGVGPGTTQLSTTIRLSNLGYQSDIFQISVSPSPSGPVPVPSTTSVRLDSDTYFDLPVSFTSSGLGPGSHQGFIQIQGTNSGTVARVPYWYGVPSATPAYITLLGVASPVPVASVIRAIWFRVTDASGINVDVTPTVNATAGGGSVISIGLQGPDFPDIWTVKIMTGRIPADNVFTIAAGTLTKTVTIATQ